MCACAFSNASRECRVELSLRVFRLLSNRRKKLAQRAPQSMQLIDKIKDDGNAFVVHPQVVLEVADEMRPGKINLGKLERMTVSLRQKPSGLHPCVQHLRLNPRLREKFARLH